MAWPHDSFWFVSKLPTISFGGAHIGFRCSQLGSVTYLWGLATTLNIVFSVNNSICIAHYSLHPKMIVWVQLFIDFVDVEIFSHTTLFGKILYINKINKDLNSDNHYGTKILWRVGQSFWDKESIDCKPPM